MPPVKSLKFGHRGASGHLPENTLLAFNKALEMGCDGVELDGSLTSDGKVVIIHDKTLNRTTNGKGLVVETSFDEIQKLDAGSWFSYKFKGLQIPTMEKVLDWAQEKGSLVNFELKNLGMIDLVGKAILSRGLENQVFVTSFLHSEIIKFKKKYPTIKVGFIFDRYPLQPSRLVDDVKKNNINILSLKAELIFKWRGENIVNLAHKAGLEVHVWDVNNESSVKRMKALAVEALIGNYPELL